MMLKVTHTMGMEQEPKPSTELIQIRDICMCPECSGPFMYPTDWTKLPAPQELYMMDMHCGNCEFEETQLVNGEESKLFEERQRLQVASIERDWKRLVVENMQECEDRLSRALADNHIRPEDF